MTPLSLPQLSHSISPQNGTTFSLVSRQEEQRQVECGYSFFSKEQDSQFKGLQNPPFRLQYAPADLTVVISGLCSSIKAFISSSVSILKIFLLFFIDLLFDIIQYIRCSVACTLKCMQHSNKGYQPQLLSSPEEESLINAPPHPEQVESTCSAKREVDSRFDFVDFDGVLFDFDGVLFDSAILSSMNMWLSLSWDITLMT